ncbi:hypothetical protein O9G_000603 [Rozella allomycis CSF55]|uniref:LsmAD domain-containing protein n=1 Tax=Rozella allomycis (strain CSF55) TaxID=988480 RepID=A0A075B0R3_ROZAC|nr:hypothetical protein O9G_000603 [Rozella allomycis CSF55]|eukprot:EPZ34416.1 hypothetical protein O9G_000603 [Rozella allomycis CSF55]
MRDGGIFEGIFHSAGEANSPIITLFMAQSLEKDHVFHDEIVLSYNDIISITASKVDTTFAEKPKDKPDTDISGASGNIRERELTPWIPDESDDKEFVKENKNESWDQFKVNEKLFGVKSNFNEEIYTTVLDKNDENFKKREKEAQKIANEILNGTLSLKLYGAVVRESLPSMRKKISSESKSTIRQIISRNTNFERAEISTEEITEKIQKDFQEFAKAEKEFALQRHAELTSRKNIESDLKASQAKINEFFSKNKIQSPSKSEAAKDTKPKYNFDAAEFKPNMDADIFIPTGSTTNKTRNKTFVKERISKKSSFEGKLSKRIIIKFYERGSKEPIQNVSPIWPHFSTKTHHYLLQNEIEQPQIYYNLPSYPYGFQMPYQDYGYFLQDPNFTSQFNTGQGYLVDTELNNYRPTPDAQTKNKRSGPKNTFGNHKYKGDKNK